MKTIVIIGGGIGGLAAAACLRHRGVTAHVYERATEWRETGAALALWPNATRILRQIGLLESLLERSTVTPRFSEVREWSGRLLKRLPMPDLDAPAVFVHRGALLELLRQAVPDQFTTLGKTFVGMETDDARIRATFADGSLSPWADGVVGADGLYSAVRQQLFGEERAVYRGYIAWRGVATIPTAVQPAQVWGRGTRFGLVPLGADQVGWWATANVSTPETTVMRETPERWKAEVLRLFGSGPSPLSEVIAATPGERVLCHMIQDREPRAHGCAQAITLLGDAAHPATPNLGQGACMAFEDAAVLAHAVEAIPETAPAFRVYEATRFTRTGQVVRDSRRLGKIGQ